MIPDLVGSRIVGPLPEWAAHLSGAVARRKAEALTEAIQVVAGANPADPCIPEAYADRAWLREAGRRADAYRRMGAR